MNTRSRTAALLAVVTMSGVLVSCGTEARGTDVASAPAAPRQIIVALDLSGSQSEGRRAEARRTLDMIIDDIGWGDQLVLLEVHQGGVTEDGAARWVETAPAPPAGRAPTSLDHERLEAMRKAARSVGQTMFARDSAGRLPRTDIFATLHIAAEYIRDGERRPVTVILLSDMLQSAHGIEMSRQDGMPARDFIPRQRTAGLLPELDGACVAVIGADATTPHGVNVRRFWSDYFGAAGAQLSYRLMATSRSGIGC